MFGHQLATFLRSLGGHHLVVHALHGLHLRIHPVHVVGCGHAAGRRSAHGLGGGGVAGDQRARGGKGKGKCKWDKSKTGHDRLLNGFG